MPSSVIATFHYDIAEKILVIVFTSGMVYKYKKVPKKVYDEMKAAFSKGIYFNQHIKDKYEFEKA